MLQEKISRHAKVQVLRLGVGVGGLVSEEDRCQEGYSIGVCL